MRRFSPAKLNLFLHITAKRTDGYHDLQSVFCLIDFGDVLTFELANDTAPLLTLTGAEGLTDEVADNLIYKAVHTLSVLYPTHARPLSIHLQKHLPTGAGLGGGSSNCATTLMAVNELWGLGLTTDELVSIGAKLGADVPFFIFAHAHQSSAIVEGIGDKLSPIALPACEFALLLPKAHLSTAQFFAKNELKRDCPIYAHDELKRVDFYDLPSDFGNVFEPLAVACSDEVAQALAYLQRYETLAHSRARMTGTGAVVFLPIAKLDEVARAELVKNAPCQVVVAKLQA